MFSTISNSYPHWKLTCYDDNGSELERKEEGKEFTSGTTCVFLSTGHVSTGGFVIEMFCQEARWHVVLTELWSLPLLQFWTPRHIMSLPPNKKFHIHTVLQFGVVDIKNEISEWNVIRQCRLIKKVRDGTRPVLRWYSFLGQQRCPLKTKD